MHTRPIIIVKENSTCHNALKNYFAWRAQQTMSNFSPGYVGIGECSRDIWVDWNLEWWTWIPLHWQLVRPRRVVISSWLLILRNRWPEQNSDQEPGRYANSKFDHTGWQSLITSFITAFKNRKPASGMRPPTGKVAIGSMWYKSVLQSTVCPYPDANQYSKKPNGFSCMLYSLPLSW